MTDSGGYRIGDVANGYVLTEQGWRPLAVESPGPEYPPAPAYPPLQPAYQPAPGTPSRRGLWIVVVVVVAVLVVGAAGAAALALANARRAGRVAAPPVSTSTAGPSSPSASDPVTTEPEPSDTAAAESPTPVAEGKPFAFGETASLRLGGVDAAEITVAAPVEFTAATDADRPDRGRLVYVPVMVTVTGKEKVSVDPFDFEVVLPDGEQVDVTYVRQLPTSAPAALAATEIAPGKAVVASLPFDVPPGTPLKIAYAPNQEVLGTWK